jgi:hypothetical protein
MSRKSEESFISVSNCERQTLPLVREGAAHQEIRSSLTNANTNLVLGPQMELDRQTGRLLAVRS